MNSPKKHNGHANEKAVAPPTGHRRHPVKLDKAEEIDEGNLRLSQKNRTAKNVSPSQKAVEAALIRKQTSPVGLRSLELQKHRELKNRQKAKAPTPSTPPSTRTPQSKTAQHVKKSPKRIFKTKLGSEKSISERRSLKYGETKKTRKTNSDERKAEREILPQGFVYRSPSTRFPAAPAGLPPTKITTPTPKFVTPPHVAANGFPTQQQRPMPSSTPILVHHRPPPKLIPRSPDVCVRPGPKMPPRRLPPVIVAPKKIEPVKAMEIIGKDSGLTPPSFVSPMPTPPVSAPSSVSSDRMPFQVAVLDRTSDRGSDRMVSRSVRPPLPQDTGKYERLGGGAQRIEFAKREQIAIPSSEAPTLREVNGDVAVVSRMSERSHRYSKRRCRCCRRRKGSGRRSRSKKRKRMIIIIVIAVAAVIVVSACILLGIYMPSKKKKTG